MSTTSPPDVSPGRVVIVILCRYLVIFLEKVPKTRIGRRRQRGALSRLLNTGGIIFEVYRIRTNRKTLHSGRSQFWYGG